MIINEEILNTFSILCLYGPFLFKGLLVTFGLLFGSICLGLIIGTLLAVFQVYGNKHLSNLASFYIWFFRGLPVLVLVFLFYFGLFPALGLRLSTFTSAVLILGTRSAAYQSQTFRGPLLSLNVGQMLAARSLGMTQSTAIWNIIIPQMLRLSIPGWSNEYAALLKDSAVTYAIGVMELLTRANCIINRTFIVMPIYITISIIYITLTYGGVKLLSLLEKKVRIPGYGEER